MRRTPSAARSLTVYPKALLLRKLIGFGATALIVAAICSRVLMPGEYRQSAPASAKAFNLRIVSSRSGRFLMKPFGTRGEDHVTACFVDCIARRAHTLYRQIEVVERISVVAGGILDRQAGNAGVDTKPDVRRDFVGIVGVAAFEIGVDRECRLLARFHDNARAPCRG